MPDPDASVYPDTARVISDIRAVAREHGYAIAVHGSLWPKRDIDLVAIPWTPKAHARRTLLRAIEQIDYLYRSPRDADDAAKPHGRHAHVFNLRRRLEGTPFYVDLSVMPRQRDWSVSENEARERSST